jgi:hypothetical protein
MTAEIDPTRRAGPDREGRRPASEPDRRDVEVPVGSQTPPTSAEYTVAFSPRQVAVGLAIVAGLVAVALSRRRRRRAARAGRRLGDD